MSNLPDTDRLLDLKSLSKYSSLGVGTLRDYIRSGGLPHFKLKGKILVRLAEFNNWVESFRVGTKQELDALVNDVIESLNNAESKG
ncbi:MAG: helix-turn-helix domain-containing protein [Desulfobacteraceae bacterium]|nr:helix-turn-helix domain-containing protein [Desulfobacteraceae bacterium]MDH3875422.1 helix-turn-helix domain-containing protein [Desulfobacteraceae bacterium]